jgi:GTP-binding protein HflX
LEQVKAERRVRRGPRQRHGLPIISIVGYTNAGKSTLLNTLTRAEVLAEDRLFATLDPTSRRLRFPKEREVIITDTVGFIRDLPKDLLEAFKATLEELEDADLLLHVIDLSNPRFEEQMEAVDKILATLELGGKPVLKVFNKMDLMLPELAAWQSRSHDGVAISAMAAGRKLFSCRVASTDRNGSRTMGPFRSTRGRFHASDCPFAIRRRSGSTSSMAFRNASQRSAYSSGEQRPACNSP